MFEAAKELQEEMTSKPPENTKSIDLGNTAKRIQEMEKILNGALDMTT